METIHPATKEYLKSLLSQPTGSALPTKGETAVMVKRIQQGDSGAEEDIKAKHIHLVRAVAKKYIGQGLTNEQLIEAGNEGLVLAAKRYDFSSKYKFLAYATWWIETGISHKLEQNKKKD